MEYTEVLNRLNQGAVINYYKETGITTVSVSEGEQVTEVEISMNILSELNLRNQTQIMYADKKHETWTGKEYNEKKTKEYEELAKLAETDPQEALRRLGII